MKLVVGLGNPGRKYAGTRHNVGYQVLAELARRHGLGSPRAKFHGDVVEADLQGQRALLLAPTTYMNRSGRSVRAAQSYYKLDDRDLLVICDDMNLPVAKLRLRSKGSAGGQKGLSDIIDQLGTEEFARLRIGIGPAPEGWEWSAHVLSKFDQQELSEIEQAVLRAADAVVVWAHEGIEASMNRFN